MRPILFNKNEQSFDTYGLGELNVTKGTVTRERNGNYTLYAEIPVNDPMVASLEKEMKLKADAGLRTKNQTFEISRIVKDSSNIVKIYGQHISHKLEYMVLRNATAFSGTAYNALAIWKGALIGDLTFDVWSDIQTSNKGMFDISKMENARLALGGVEGSILDLYGGEYEFDNMTIRLHKQLGRTAPTVLEYGRNILSAELDETIESAYTSVLPFATYTPEKPAGDTSDSQPDPVTVTIPENYIDSKYKSLYAHRRIKVVDFSSEFSTDSKKKNIPTADKLRKLATDYMNKNAIGKPKINIKIEYADLAKTLDYADNGWIEELELCDIIPIYYPQIGLTDETAKVTTITYDFVNERNESVEFGDIGTNVRSTMQSGLAGKVDDIAKAQQDFENSLPGYLLNAQGNKVWYNHPDDKEHKIGDIWFEKNGIYDRMYVWNGSMWEKRIDTEDVDKIKKEVDKQLEQARQSTNLEIEKVNAKAQEALVKAGTIPDAGKLSEQIKTLILNSPDLNRKVTESLYQTDSGVIYNKILQNVKTDFISKQVFDGFERSTNTGLADLRNKADNTESAIQRQTVEFNKLTESNKLYERIIGTSETDAPDKLSRLVMSSEIFQTEVGKYVTDDFNLVYDPTNLSKWKKKQSEANVVEVTASTKLLRITNSNKTNSVYHGFALPLNTSTFTQGEKISYRFEAWVDVLPDAPLGIELWSADGGLASDRVYFDKTGIQIITGTMTVNKTTTNSREFPLEFWLMKNGQVAIGKVSLVRGDRPPNKFVDSAAMQGIATQTQVTQLEGSWAVRNLNGNGDVLNSINVLANGTNRIDGRLTHITGQTKIDNAVIKDGMIANLSADKLTAGTIDASQINVINVNASNVLAGTLTGMTVRGGRVEALNGKMNIDLQNSQYNVLSNEATIRRIDDTNSSQFISLKKSGFVAEHFRDSNAALMIFGTNHNKKTPEAHDNASFAGIRLWSGKGNGTTESLTEFIGDRVLIYNNGPNRSPWNFHNNINGKQTYLLPMNENGVKHYIGRGDFFLEAVYSRKVILANGKDVGTYLWDLLGCFGTMMRYGMVTDKAIKNHIQEILNGYGFK
ncbi:phage tail spike protein [Streptococcus sp. S1]|uniref:Phage tail spike protein n=1 Tax=Streptococcus dentalis TaxID=3098075 RepID=A0ABZ0T157_9STRE|nr:phage tail spike protein [Streptococcus sp. S1]WPS53050.1 phage tail spike protein [Streptococcus sp. S1]